MSQNNITIIGENSQSVPLILDSPHSGTNYPKDFNHQADLMRLRQAEDTYVDELFDYNNAEQMGIACLRAEFPRSYIDANRSEKDFNPEHFEYINDAICDIPFAPGVKSKLGIGLIWLRVPPDGEPMYTSKITPEILMNRVNNYHRPYHQALQRIMNHTYERYQRFYHINCHSMQNHASAMSEQPKGTLRPDFVIGDRDGTTAEREFRDIIVNTLTKLGYDVKVNDPYKGVELVAAYSNPAIHKNSIQVEINRKLYMNEVTREKNDSFIKTKNNLIILVQEVKNWIINKQGK
jgi:N-formylglutamate deformylase